MANNQIKTRIINKHDTAANWELAVNFIPKQGEIIIYDKDSTYNYERFKIGDGVTLVSALPFVDDALKVGIQTSLDDINWSLTSFKSSLEQIGGRNLFTHTRDFNNIDNSWNANLSGWFTSDEIYQGCVVKQKATAWGGLWQEIEVKAKESYTLSAWVKRSENARVLFFCENSNKNGTDLTSLTGTDWQRISITFENSNNEIITPRFENPVGNENLYICGIKLEKGCVATDWTPAPEDIENFKIGGRNYILGTDQPYTVIGDPSKQKTVHPFLCFNVDIATTLYGKTVVVSFDYESTVTSGHAYMGYNNAWQKIYSFEPGDTSGHIELVTKLNIPEVIDTKIIYLQGTWEGNVTISNLKLEIGNKATDWTPAVEDSAKNVSGIVEVRNGGTGASSIEGAQNILSIMPKSEIQKLYCSMIPAGTSIPSYTDLNTIDYIKVGNYYCSYSDAVKTLINCPTSLAFMMQVYSPLSETYDNESTSTWCYRLRKIITHTGEEYYQKVNSNDTKGNFYYEPWYKIIRSNNLVSDSDNGLMTSALFTKLNNISDSADSVSFSPALTSGTKIGTITINGSGTDLYCQTNTNTTYTNGTGLSLNGTTFSLATSGVTAGTYGPSAAVTGNNNTTMNVPEITVDSYGRVTKVTNRVYTSKDTSYTLPNATSSTLGGVKIGSNIAVSNGTISLTKTNVTDALGYTPPTSDTNTTYTIATGDGNGQIKVTPSSGNAYNVSIKGLGSAAYKNASGSWDITAAKATAVTGVVGVSNGGTGSSNADTACANLGAVKKSGDTMTGNLTVPSLKINSPSNELQIIQMHCPHNNALSGRIICDAKTNKRRFSFSIYHWDQDSKAESQKVGERYRLPEPVSGLTTEVTYDILTTKSVKMGTSKPSDSSGALGDIFFLYNV